MTRPIEQRLAEAQSLLQKRKEQQRQSLTRQKIIIGAAVMKAAQSDAEVAKWCLETLQAGVTRPIDQKAIEPLLSQLENIVLDAVPRRRNVLRKPI